jgi:hypothetical protein
MASAITSGGLLDGQTVVAHGASRAGFNVNGQDHLSKDRCPVTDISAR